jgi:ribonuclease BN (tRNA processing enzyme)
MLLFEKRTKPLTIICTKQVREAVESVTHYIFKTLENKDGFDVNFLDIQKEDEIEFNGLKLSFEAMEHSIDDTAIKISDGKKSIIYGGDGAPIQNDNFYKDVDLLILEAYLYDKEMIGHASVVSAINFAEKNNVKSLALVHMEREFRKNEPSRLRDKIKSDKVEVIVPEPMDEYNF